MKFFGLLSLALIVSLGADELSFGQFPLTANSRAPSQALQIHSSTTLQGALDSLKKVPPYYRTHVEIHQSGEHFATCYQNSKYPKILPWIIRDFKKAGFSDAFVTYPDNGLSTPLSGNAKPKNIKAPPPQTNLQAHTQPLSGHDQTRLILDAQSAYQKRDYAQATIYYEMMAASGIKDRQILLNLCYLYGREGSAMMMQRLIEGKRGTNDYLYAYGVGALEAGRSDLYSVLSPHLIYDKSGKLAMLCGYFFDQENNPERSKAFYKMAHDAAPSDPHITYAYARNVDISGEKTQAIYWYTQLTQLSSEFETLRAAAQSRIQALRREQ